MKRTIAIVAEVTPPNFMYPCVVHREYIPS